MNYLFNCKKCGVIEIKCSPDLVKENMKCPKCFSEVKRIYTPITSIWKCDGACGKSN